MGCVLGACESVGSLGLMCDKRLGICGCTANWIQGSFGCQAVLEGSGQGEGILLFFVKRAGDSFRRTPPPPAS